MTLVSRFCRDAVLAGVLGATLGFGGFAMAQQAAPEPPQASDPLNLPDPPPATMAAARDLVVSSGMSRSFAPMAPELAKQIVPTVTRTHPEMTADLQEVVKQLEPEFEADGQRMTDIAAKIYARRMSEDELKQASAFFKSPAGAKYVEVQPLMLDELVVAMQSWTQQLSNMMMSRVREEMAKKGHNIL